MIAILGTDMQDFQPLLEKRFCFHIHDCFGIRVFIANVYCQKVLFANIGTSKVESVVNYLSLLCCYNITHVIFIGNTAGLENQPLNSIAIASSTSQYDVNFSALGLPIGQIPNMGLTTFDADPNLVAIAQSASDLIMQENYIGKIISGDQFINSLSTSTNLQTQWDASFLDAEIGALAEASYLKSIPFVAVKGISNFANNNAPLDYNTNRQTANILSLNVALKMLEIGLVEDFLEKNICRL